MALTTYSDLKTTIATFLNRDDLTAIIPSFIELAEAGINRSVRHWRMEERVTATVSTRYFTRPSDWLDTVRLTVNNADYRELRLISMSEMARRRQQAADVAGVPQFFSHSQDEIELFPTPSEAMEVELIYTQSVVPLSDSNTSNWLLAAAPDVYLYGALLHSAPYLRDDPRIAVWAELYTSAVQALNRSGRLGEASGETLVMGAPV